MWFVFVADGWLRAGWGFWGCGLGFRTGPSECWEHAHFAQTSSIFSCWAVSFLLWVFCWRLGTFHFKDCTGEKGTCYERFSV